jgi:hypothetical protein
MYYCHKIHSPSAIILVVIVYIFINYSGSTFASNPVFRSWEYVLTPSPSDYLKAEIADMPASPDYINNHPWLSEEFIFIQSNTRMETGSNDNMFEIKVSRDFNYMCIIDNYCCLQTNA